jgi:hypothetical protein
MNAGGELVSSSKRKMQTLTLLIGMVLLTEIIGATPLYASFCQVSNVVYNYPQKVTPSQSFGTTVNVSGVCVPNVEYSYTIRVDLSNMSGQILASNFGSIGYGTGQNWQVTVPNKITAPASANSWQIQFTVYVFASISSGIALDYKTTKPVTIQISTT